MASLVSPQLVSALAGLLSLSEPDDHSTRHPRLCVNLWRVPRTDITRLRTVLSLLAHVLRVGCSVRLWQQLLQEPRVFVGGRALAAESGAITLVERLLGDERLPRVVLDLSRTTMTKELSSALSTFFQPPTALDDCVGARVKVDVRLAKCRLATPELFLIHELLDNAFGAQANERQFGLGELDLSDNRFSASELLVLAAILQKNHVYGLDAIVLENVVGRTLGDSGTESFCALIAAAFNVDTVTTPHTGLARLSLQSNALNSAAYASVCSAFRHSRIVKDLSLAGTLVTATASTRAQCWRWLAIGVFAPGPQDATQAFPVRRIDLSSNLLSIHDVEAFRRALLDPVGELVAANDVSGSLRDAVESQTRGACVVPKGAVIRQYPTDSAVQLLQLEREMELEVLCTAGQWACVLVPGFQYGWTLLTRGTIVRSTGSDQPESAVRFELVLNRLRDNAATLEALAVLLEVIGNRLCGLELQHNRLSPHVVTAIAEHCTQLERLDLEGCSLSGVEPTLQRALRGDLGARLAALNLNHTKVGFAFTEELAMVLRDQERAPPLRELRLFNCLIGDRGLDSLQHALFVNRTLVRLELGPVDSARDSAVELVFHRRNHNEVLRVEPLPMAQRLAFLSLFSLSASEGTTVKRELDSWMLRTVLDFAACEVRRQIVWRS